MESSNTSARTTGASAEPIPDPNITVSVTAPQKTQELWRCHDLINSKSYPDASLDSMNALIEYSARTYDDQTAFYYPATQEPIAPYTSISWRDFYEIKIATAARYSDLLREICERRSKRPTNPALSLQLRS